MSRYFVVILFWLMNITGCMSNSSIPAKTNVLAIEDERVNLVHIKDINLKVGLGVNIGDVKDIRVTGQTLLLIDGLSRRIHEFNLNGSYRGTVGEAGKGTGKFLDPATTEIDALENIYLSDGGTGKLLMYDKKRRFVEYLHNSRKYLVEKLAIDREGNLFKLSLKWKKHFRSKSTPVSILEKIDRNRKKEIYSVQLSDDSTGNLISVLGSWAGFCYIPEVNRIYHQLPWECNIREIDGRTGDIKRILEIQIPEYRPLRMPENKIINPKFVTELIKKGIVRSLNAIDGRYLLMRYSIGENTYCYLIDLGNEEIKAYALEHGVLSRTNIRITTSGALIYVYVYTPPAFDKSEIHGKIKVYALKHNIE